MASTVASMCCGFFYAWSVLAKPLMQMHGWTSAEVALGFTIVVAVPAMCTLLAGKLQQYIRPPTLLLISGTILGLGTVLAELRDLTGPLVYVRVRRWARRYGLSRGHHG